MFKECLEVAIYMRASMHTYIFLMLKLTLQHRQFRATLIGRLQRGRALLLAGVWWGRDE